jgi:hypothetical protein
VPVKSMAMATLKATIETISKLEAIEIEGHFYKMEKIEQTQLDWECTSVLSPLPMRIWRNFLFVIHIQMVIMDNDVFYKIFRKLRGYFRPQRAWSPLAGDEKHDGPLRYLSLLMREHGRILFSVNLYNSEKATGDRQGTSTHKDTPKNAGKQLLHIFGAIEYCESASDFKPPLFSTDCTNAARITQGTNNALSGKAGDNVDAEGRDNPVHHRSINAKVDPSAVLQSRRDDRGPAAPENGIETLCIYEWFAKRVSTRTVLDKILKQIGPLLDDPSVTDLVTAVAESSFSWAEVLDFPHTDPDDDPSTPEQQQEIDRLLIQVQDLLFNGESARINELAHYAPRPESYVPMELADLLLGFPKDIVRKWYLPPSYITQDPTYLRGAGYNRNKDMMFVRGGSFSFIRKFKNTPGADVFFNLVGVYFEEYQKAADDEEPNTEDHRLKRSHVVGKFIAAFHLATEGWFFCRSGEDITQLSWINVLKRVGRYLLGATEQSVREHIASTAHAKRPARASAAVALAGTGIAGGNSTAKLPETIKSEANINPVLAGILYCSKSPAETANATATAAAAAMKPAEFIE